MKTVKVSQLMIPIAEYTAVREDATLQDAVLALRKAWEGADVSREKHRSVIVLNRDGMVVGHLTQWDVCRGLEPKYESIGDLEKTSRYGFSPEFIKSLLDTHGLWRKPLDDICGKGAGINVREIMNSPGKGEYVDADATLDEAIHQLVMGHHQCLLVTRAERIVGLLRMSEVFNEICGRIVTCGV